VRITANEPETVSTAERSDASTRHHEHEGLGERIGHFFSSLFGGHHDEDVNDYSEAVRRGGAVVIVYVENDDEADRAADILDSRGAVDVNERAREWRQTGWAGSAPGASSLARDSVAAGGQDETVIPVVKEELQVGKRRRERGGVRIYSGIEQAPVEESVRLREEHAVVERRPADRPATDADFAAFKEGTIEVRETVEEPVVAKQARVVEEVVVGKEVTERTETVRDEVRNGRVDVERLDAGSTREAAGTRQSAAAQRDDWSSDYRSHWQTNYASAGGRYEDYQPAYEYGSTLAQDERYRNRNWAEIESDARRDWETRHPGSAWERFKAAVQHGWERVTGRR
jgi:uncharacterized protein (TIGR02271 family)